MPQWSCWMILDGHYWMKIYNFSSKNMKVCLMVFIFFYRFIHCNVEYLIQLIILKLLLEFLNSVAKIFKYHVYYLVHQKP